MTNRREFLQIGAGATAWPLVARAAQAAGIDRWPNRTPLLALVYDPRFAESVAFAERGGAQGLRALPIANGDMTRLWFDQIHPRWREHPVGLAGLTAYGPMFCFTELARDVGMRLIFRGEHTASDAGTSHAFTGPLPMVTDAIRACRHRSPGASMADVVAGCPAGRQEISSAAVTVPGSTVGVAEPMYTWVIAPAVRA